MALFRKTVTRALPKNASILTGEDGDVVKWTDRKGVKRKAEVVYRGDGTPRIREKAKTWTAKYRDGQGVVREVSTGCREKQAALSVLNDLTKRAEQVRAGVLSPEQDQIADHQLVPLVEHIDAYLDDLRKRKCHPDRIKTMDNRLKRSAEACGFKRLSDLNADRLEEWLSELTEAPKAEDGERKPKPVSASVYNGYIECWVGFGFWCVGKRIAGKRSNMKGDKRLLSNPFEGMRRLDTNVDRRRVARAFTEEELTRLLATARRRPLLDAMTIRTGANKGKPLAKVAEHRKPSLDRLGLERALIYKTLVLTGLRSNELRTLRCQDLSLGDTPSIKLRNENEKNRGGSTVALRSDLAEDLRAWTSGLHSSDPVFKVPKGLLRIMNRDLELAGIPKVSAEGDVVHVHALRHSFGTHLSKAGVTPRVAQAAMRHSDIGLTMGTYTDTRLLDTVEAVESLPTFTIPTSACLASHGIGVLPPARYPPQEDSNGSKEATFIQ